MSASIDLAGLRAKNLPHCTFDAVISFYGIEITPKDDTTPEEAAELVKEIRAEFDKYAAGFLPPASNCITCGARLGGLFGSFTWGMENGEGECGECHYPARGHHHQDRGAGLTLRNCILQYHPDALTTRAERGSAVPAATEGEKR